MDEHKQQPEADQTFDVQKVIAQAKMVLSNPRGFYQTMPRSGGFANPVIFVAAMALVTGLVTAFLSLFSGSFAIGLGSIIFYPIAAVIGGFIASAVLFVIWKLMGSQQNYESAFRCWSATTALYPIAAILSIFPYIGAIVSILWSTYLIIEATVTVHERKRKTAQIVFGILAVFFLISNIGSEYASRQAADRFSEMSKQFEDFDQMSPEDAGRKMGEFLKGFEQGASAIKQNGESE